MSKFTIFTVILAVSVITVVADLALRQYFEEDGSASVVSVGEETQTEPPREKDVDDAPVSAQPQEPLPVIKTLPLTTVATPNVTPELFKSAEFTGTATEKHFEGKLYQLLDISQIPVEGISLFEVPGDSSAGSPSVAAVTEISLRDEIRALQLYVLLQNRTKPYIDLSLNETNAYGDRSFYINHAKKPNEAFLTVKVGKTIYGFAYVKTYHPQIKKFIQLLSQ